MRYHSWRIKAQAEPYDQSPEMARVHFSCACQPLGLLLSPLFFKNRLSHKEIFVSCVIIVAVIRELSECPVRVRVNFSRRPGHVRVLSRNYPARAPTTATMKSA